MSDFHEFSPTHNLEKTDCDLIDRVLSRLQSRKRLHGLAKAIFKGSTNLELATHGLVGEEDPVIFCTKPNPFVFECPPAAKVPGGFDCTGAVPPFDCDPKIGTYGDCNGSKTPTFSCDSKTPFQCVKTKGVFDCLDYACGKSTEEYNCDSDYDFHCSWLYTCTAAFQCSAGHIFLCATGYTCAVTFSCKAGSDVPKEQCDPLNPPYKCPETAEYGWDGGKDTTPGDFYCGTTGESKDTFNCKHAFQCATKSNFICTGSTRFKCGSGTTGDTFDCTVPNNGYECKQTVSCNIPGTKYSCSDANFTCNDQTPYTPPG